jgi:hypothetical protein
MQNKPNFQKTEMKLNFYSAKDYGNESRLRTPKNKPNQTQSCPPKHQRRRIQKVHLLSPGAKHFWIAAAFGLAMTEEVYFLSISFFIWFNRLGISQPISGRSSWGTGG